MIGKTLGHYRVVGSLGKGGMGEVWIAEDTRLNRKVALKTLPAELARDPARRARFERESQAIAALNHPNIVTIHSVEQASGVGFITMELIEGDTLTEHIPTGGLAFGPFLDVAIPLAAALAAAHDKGITHRDVKPDNLMVTPDGHLKVLDFGLAKLAAADTGDPSSSATRTAVTEEGRILGTVAYMSPEQAEGKPVDARSDVFSLGVVLYQMATGETPFRGDTPISTITSIMRDEPPPIRTLRPALPRELDRIVGRCFAKDPDERYPTARELHRELVELKSGSTSEGAAAVARRGPRRRLVFWGAFVVAVALVLALPVVVMLWNRSGEAPAEVAGAPVEASIAVLPFTSVGSDEASLSFSSGIHNDLLIRLSKIGALKVISRTSVMEYRDTTKNLRQIADELGVATVLEGSVQRSGDRVRLNAQLVNARNDESMWAETYDRELSAASIFDIQEDVAGEIAAALKARLTLEEQQQLEVRPTNNLEAYEAYLRALEFADRSELETDQILAAQMIDRAVALDPEFAEAHAHRGRLYTQLYWSHIDRSPERLARAWEAIETAERLSPGMPEASMARGFYYYWGFLEYARALEEFAAAAKGLPNNTTIISGIGFVMRRQGRMEEAVGQLRRAAELNPRDLVAAANVTYTLTLMREYGEADEVLTALLQLNPTNAQLWAYQARLHLMARGDVDRACESLRQAEALNLKDSELVRVEISPALIECELPAVRAHLDTLGEAAVLDDQFSYVPREMVEARLHALDGDAEAARASYDAARLHLEAKARELPDDERIPSALGLAYAALGRKDEAIREGLRGVEMLPYDKEAVRGVQRVADLAEIYTRVGEPDLAIDRLEFLLERPGFLSAPYLKVDPTWDPLRENPRFRRLVG